MDISSGLLPIHYFWLAAAIYTPLLVIALLSAPWRKVLDSEASHVYFGAIVFVTVLWSMHAGIDPGPAYHLLGATTLCLMFEWQFALLAISLVLLITTWQGSAGWQAYALNALVMGALPILFTRAMLYFTQRYLPHNFFIYIFVNAFLTGALGMLLCGAVAATILSLGESPGLAPTGGDYLLFIPMLMFGEAFLNGMAMTLLVAYKPRWVATFHDQWYLDGK